MSKKINFRQHKKLVLKHKMYNMEKSLILEKAIADDGGVFDHFPSYKKYRSANNKTEMLKAIKLALKELRLYIKKRVPDYPLDG